MILKPTVQISVMCHSKEEEAVKVDYYSLAKYGGAGAIVLDIGCQQITIHGTDDLFLDISTKISQAVLDAHINADEKEKSNVA